MRATIWPDIRYALRLFGRERSFAAMAVVTLALGLGSTTAVFSIVNGVLLRPLAYAPSDRIVQVVQLFGRDGTIGDGSSSLSSSIVIREVFEAWRSSATTVDGLAAFGNRSVTLVGAGDPMRLMGATVSPRLFTMLDTRALAGRLFEDRESRPGAAPVALIGEALWRSRFGADPGVIGRRLTMDDESVTVIGVLPSTFAFPAGETAVWLPFVETPPPPTVPGQRFVGGFSVLARLAPGFSLDQAAAEATVVARRVQTALGGFSAGDEDPTTISLVPLKEQIVQRVRPALLILLGAVGAVLLIGTFNLAQLLLARGTARRREMAVRSAIGASRSRVTRLVLVENIVTSLAGGLLGVSMAYGMVRALPAIGAVGIPRLADVTLDFRVLGFAFAISLVTAVLSGILPALQASRTDAARVLADDSASVASGFRWRRRPLRTTLIAAELAVTLVLMVGAALLIESFTRLVRVDPGYDAAHVVTGHITLPLSRYPPARRSVFLEELLERTARLPGVRSAGITRSLPLTPFRTMAAVSLPSSTPGPAERINAEFRIVSPGYIPALGLRIREGRALADTDRVDTPRVALVSETFIRRHLPAQRAIGTHLRIARLDDVEIVGVVSDVHHAALSATPAPEVYMSFRQTGAIPGSTALVLRGAEEAAPSTLIANVRATLREMDPALPFESAMTMEQRLSSSVTEPRFYTVLLGLFAALAMGIAVVGVYGITAYNVAQRRREIGVRVALGARTTDVLRLFVGQNAGTIVVALVLGLVAAGAATRVLQRFLFEVSPLDLSAFVSAAVLLAAAATVGSFVPARHAARVDPVEALRR